MQRPPVGMQHWHPRAALQDLRQVRPLALSPVLSRFRPPINLLNATTVLPFDVTPRKMMKILMNPLLLALAAHLGC